MSGGNMYEGGYAYRNIEWYKHCNEDDKYNRWIPLCCFSVNYYYITSSLNTRLIKTFTADTIYTINKDMYKTVDLNNIYFLIYAYHRI